MDENFEKRCPQIQMTINRLESIKNEENHSINSTYYDSLHNIKIYSNSNNIKENQTKLNNFYLALNSIRNKYNINHLNSINEFSEACANLSKEENIKRYLFNPIKKEIIKRGNNLVRVSNIHDYRININKPYTFDLCKHVFENYVLEENKKNEKRTSKRTLNNNNKDKGSTTALTGYELNNNESIEIKPFNLEVINDLDEIKDVNLEEYKNKDKNNQEILVVDSIFEDNDNNNYKNNINLQNSNNKFYFRSSKGLKSSNDKKLRQKFFKSEFRNKRIKNLKEVEFFKSQVVKRKDKKNKESINNNSSSSSNIIIAQNLLNKFNSCSRKSKSNNIETPSSQNQKKEINNNSIIIKNTSKISSGELIDFLSENNILNNDNITENENLTPIKKIDSNNIINNNYNNNSNFSTPKNNIKPFNLYITSNKKNKKSTSVSLTLSNSKKDENEEFQGQTIYDLDFYNNLLNYEKDKIKIEPNYINKYIPKITWDDRKKVINWLMQICEEFAFKRDTFHYAITYFDSILSNDTFLKKNKENINFNYLKLLGITCISISAKIEEVQIPKLSEYANSLECEYDIEDIILMEQKCVNVLQWKIIPITINTWLNWYICQWDLFIDTVDNIKDELLEYLNEENIIFFKKSDDNSYYNFKKITQLIDLIKIDENHLFYDERYLVAAAIFIVICISYDFDYDINKKEIIFEKSDIKNLLFNIYNNFIQQSFDFYFTDIMLLNCIEYLWKFKNFPFSYDLPLIYQVHQKELENGNYEDFITYQVYNEENLNYLKNIYSC